MKKITTREWIALCRTCTWSGRRSQDQTTAQQELDKHLKTHPQHKPRVMVSGEDSAIIAETERLRVEEQWKKLGSRPKQI